MSLAHASALETSKYRQHEQQEYSKHSKYETKGDPSGNVGVTGLKHLWESKGQSKITANVSNNTFTVSSPTIPVGERSPTYERKTNILPMHIATPTKLQSQRFMLETEDLPGSPRNDHGFSKVKRRWNEQGLEIASAGLPLYSNSIIGQGKYKSIIALREQSLPTRHHPSRSSGGVDQPSKSFEAQHPRIEPSTSPADHDSYHSDSRSTFSARSTPLSLTPRSGWSIMPRHYERQIPAGANERAQDCGLCNQSIRQGSSSDSQYHSVDEVEPMFSTGRQDDIGRDKEASVAGTANILEHEVDYDPTAPRFSGTQDAATQTDLVDDRNSDKDLDRDNDRDREGRLEETSSGWSESKSVVERPEERLSHQRSSKRVRLERRLGRRPGVGKVQVIVSLDGASELVVDARLKRKRGEGRSRP
ncbi:MAG: hypothetical protein Q9213_005073 [Squamulea squamosa]